MTFLAALSQSLSRAGEYIQAGRPGFAMAEGGWMNLPMGKEARPRPTGTEHFPC